jgi:hypothetical protein
MEMEIADRVANEKAQQSPVRLARSSRQPRNGNAEETGAGARFFLKKPGLNGGVPVLEHELASEGEAMVESLKLGTNYYRVQEFRSMPDYSGRIPQLRREPVGSK